MSRWPNSGLLGMCFPFTFTFTFICAKKLSHLMELRSTQSPIDKFFVLSWGYCVSGILELESKQKLDGQTWPWFWKVQNSVKKFSSSGFWVFRCLAGAILLLVVVIAILILLLLLVLLRFLSFSLFAWCVPLALTAAVIGLDVALPTVTET